MLRKILLAAAAASSLGLVALAPTSASAHWHGGHGWYGGHGFRPYVRVYTGYNSCYRKRVFFTDYGPVVKWVNVCAY
jgi:hypothetical protein